MQAREADEAAIDLRDDESVAGIAQPREASRNGLRIGRIAELTEEIRDRRGILSTCISDRHTQRQ